MAHGPGKYDASLSLALADAKAMQGILIVFDGPLGPSFCCQLDIVKASLIPVLLRQMAEEIEADMARGDVKREV